MKMRGVFLDRDTLDRGDVDITSLTTALEDWRFYGETRAVEVAERVTQADIVVSNKVMISASDIKKAPQLKLICISATGTNNVDLAAARQCGVRVCNVRGYATASVAEHVFALMLALSRQLPAYREAIGAGLWQRSSTFALLDFPISELRGKTLGIVGYGELGRAVAKLGEAFGMRIFVAARANARENAASGRLPLAELLTQVDVLSLHIPFNAETAGMIGAHELALMKPTALLINTARGGIVDEHALARALRTGALGGAGIDVLTDEPPNADHPLLASDIPRLILTPHIAWASVEARQRLICEVAANIRAFTQGILRNAVG